MNAAPDERPSLRLKGKVAVVSGAGTYGGRGVGNGAATAIIFAREGARVVYIPEGKGQAVQVSLNDALKLRETTNGDTEDKHVD